MGIGGVVVQFKANADQAIRETKKFARELDKTEGTTKKMSKGLKLGLAAVGTAAVGAGVALFDMAGAAAEDAQAQKRLATNLKNMTKATDAQVSSLEDWITKQGLLLGVTDDKLRPALSRLAASTKDVNEAQELATLAMDISAGSGKDLATVAEGLAKANDGNINALKRMGVTLGDEANNAIEYQKVQKALTNALADERLAMEEFGPASKEYRKAKDKVNTLQEQSNSLAEDGIDWQKELGKAFAGSAKEQSETAQGALDKLKLIWGEMQETIGASLVDPITEFSEFLATPQGQTWLEDLMTDVEGVAQGMAGLAENTAAFVGELMKVKDWYDSWPDWLKVNAGKEKAGANWDDPLTWLKNKKANERSNAAIDAVDQPRPTGKRIAGGGTVNVTVVNGKQEKSVDSAAMALRLAKTVGM